MIYRFGDCELDMAASELRRQGRVVALQPKPLALLAYLIRHRERVVGKDELLGELWSDAVVTESSLTKAVSVARRAIGDQGERASIRSLARRGYRFVGEVVELEGGRGVADPETAGGEHFVGRSDALATLRGAFESAAAGRGRLVLLSGAAGIGKTRLAEVFAEELRRRGAWVLFGRADGPEGAPAFWPWVQVLRELAERSDLKALAPALLAADEVVALVPELAAAAPAAGTLAHSAEQGRFLFFDAVTRLLAIASRERPLAVVVEDLDRAARPSLLLLEHLAPELRRHALLVIATLRDEPRPAGHPATRMLSLLSQLEHVVPLELGGFSREDVAALLEREIGRPPPGRLVTELYARTEGNPLFLREALRLLRDQGQLRDPELTPGWSLDLLPQRTRDMVQRHLESLSAPTRALLGAAAVLGREFRLAPLVAMAGAAREEALDRLDEAVRAGVVQEQRRTPGTYRFEHPLFREVTYESLAPGRRARLHQAAGEALERLYAEDPTPVLSDLAHHFHQGLALGDPRRAYDYAVAAAERAADVLAWEQAATHQEQALAALEQQPPVDPDCQLEALLLAGEAHRFAGERARRREVCGRAFTLARNCDRVEEQAAAAIGFCDMIEWGPRDPEGEALLSEALKAVGNAPGPERVRILTRLAYLRRLERERSEPMARDAVALARRLAARSPLRGESLRGVGRPESRVGLLDDADALQEALYTLHLILGGPDDFAERERLVREAVEAAGRSSHRDLAFIGLLDLASDRLVEGRLAEARREREAARRLAGESPHRGLEWNGAVFDDGLALLQGRFGEAERSLHETLLLGRMIDHPYAPIIFNGHVMSLLREQGRLDELPERLTPTRTHDGPRPQVWLGPLPHALPAAMAAAAGNLDEARRHYARFLARYDPEQLPRRIDWLAAVAELASACAALEDHERAPVLYALLEPYEGWQALTPVSVNYAGPVAWSLACLAGVMRERTRVVGHLEAAIEQARAVGARPAEARARLALGRLRARLGGSRDGEGLIREALTLAETLGMRGLAREARAAL